MVPIPTPELLTEEGLLTISYVFTEYTLSIKDVPIPTVLEPESTDVIEVVASPTLEPVTTKISLVPIPLIVTAVPAIAPSLSKES